MRSKRTKDHLEELAKKYNLRVSQVEEIVETPFRFFVHLAGKGDKDTLTFHSLRIYKWGLFSVKKGRKEHLKKLNDDRKEISNK